MSSTQVTVLNVPENSIFEVVQTVPQVSDQPVGEVNVADIHMNVCNDNNQEELNPAGEQEQKVRQLMVTVVTSLLQGMGTFLLAVLWYPSPNLPLLIS